MGIAGYVFGYVCFSNYWKIDMSTYVLYDGGYTMEDMKAS